MDVELVTSAPNLAGRPEEVLPEFAFLGRSNCGKSSLLNHLLGRRRLARTSAQPGKTRLLNYYRVDGRYYVVDLPGYGFARVGKTQRAAWTRLMRSYILAGDRPQAFFHLLDVRREPTPDDRRVAGWLREAGQPLAVVVTKIDKLGSTRRPRRFAEIIRALELPADTPFIPTSALAGIGRSEMLGWIEALLESAAGEP